MADISLKTSEAFLNLPDIEGDISSQKFVITADFWASQVFLARTDSFQDIFFIADDTEGLVIEIHKAKVTGVGSDQIFEPETLLTSVSHAEGGTSPFEDVSDGGQSTSAGIWRKLSLDSALTLTIGDYYTITFKTTSASKNPNIFWTLNYRQSLFPVIVASTDSGITWANENITTVTAGNLQSGSICFGYIGNDVDDTTDFLDSGSTTIGGTESARRGYPVFLYVENLTPLANTVTLNFAQIPPVDPLNGTSEETDQAMMEWYYFEEGVLPLTGDFEPVLYKTNAQPQIGASAGYVFYVQPDRLSPLADSFLPESDVNLYADPIGIVPIYESSPKFVNVDIGTGFASAVSSDEVVNSSAADDVTNNFLSSNWAHLRNKKNSRTSGGNRSADLSQNPSYFDFSTENPGQDIKLLKSVTLTTDTVDGGPDTEQSVIRGFNKTTFYNDKYIAFGKKSTQDLTSGFTDPEGGNLIAYIADNDLTNWEKKTLTITDSSPTTLGIGTAAETTIIGIHDSVVVYVNGVETLFVLFQTNATIEALGTGSINPSFFDIGYYQGDLTASSINFQLISHEQTGETYGISPFYNNDAHFGFFDATEQGDIDSLKARFIVPNNTDSIYFTADYPLNRTETFGLGLWKISLDAILSASFEASIVNTNSLSSSGISDPKFDKGITFVLKDGSTTYLGVRSAYEVSTGNIGLARVYRTNDFVTFEQLLGGTVMDGGVLGTLPSWMGGFGTIDNFDPTTGSWPTNKEIANNEVKFMHKVGDILHVWVGPSFFVEESTPMHIAIDVIKKTVKVLRKFPIGDAGDSSYSISPLISDLDKFVKSKSIKWIEGGSVSGNHIYIFGSETLTSSLEPYVSATDPLIHGVPTVYRTRWLVYDDRTINQAFEQYNDPDSFIFDSSGNAGLSDPLFTGTGIDDMTNNNSFTGNDFTKTFLVEIDDAGGSPVFTEGSGPPSPSVGNDLTVSGLATSVVTYNLDVTQTHKQISFTGLQDDLSTSIVDVGSLPSSQVDFRVEIDFQGLNPIFTGTGLDDLVASSIYPGPIFQLDYTVTIDSLANNSKEFIGTGTDDLTISVTNPDEAYIYDLSIEKLSYVVDFTAGVGSTTVAGDAFIDGDAIGGYIYKAEIDKLASDIQFTGTGADDLKLDYSVVFDGTGTDNLSIDIDAMKTTPPVVNANFIIEIDGTGPSTFKWSDDGGATFTATGVSAGTGLSLGTSNVVIDLPDDAGHVIGDKWAFQIGANISRVYRAEIESGAYEVVFNGVGLDDLSAAGNLSQNLIYTVTITSEGTPAIPGTISAVEGHETRDHEANDNFVGTNSVLGLNDFSLGGVDPDDLANFPKSPDFIFQIDEEALSVDSIRPFILVADRTNDKLHVLDNGKTNRIPAIVDEVDVTDIADVHIKGNYAYVVTESTPSTLRIYDISDLRNVSFVSSTQIDSSEVAITIEVVDNHAYVLVDNTAAVNAYYYMKIFDIANVNSPNLESTIQLDGYLEKTDFDEDIGIFTNISILKRNSGSSQKVYAFIANNNNINLNNNSGNISIVDVTDPTSPFRLDLIDTYTLFKTLPSTGSITEFHPTGSFAIDNYLFCCGTNNLPNDTILVFDISDLESVSAIDFQDTGNEPRNIYVEKRNPAIVEGQFPSTIFSYQYLAHVPASQGNGFRMFGFDPDQPISTDRLQLVSRIGTDSQNHNINIFNEKAYMGANANGYYRIYDLKFLRDPLDSNNNIVDNFFNTGTARIGWNIDSAIEFTVSVAGDVDYSGVSNNKSIASNLQNGTNSTIRRTIGKISFEPNTTSSLGSSDMTVSIDDANIGPLDPGKFIVKISNLSPEEFQWSNDGGATFYPTAGEALTSATDPSTFNLTTPSSRDMGISIQFSTGVSGNIEVGDCWKFEVGPQGIYDYRVEIESMFSENVTFSGTGLDDFTVLGTPSENKAYVVAIDSTSDLYGYGYGYGSDTTSANDFFDVFGVGSDYASGYGIEPFETTFDMEYGYGFGYEYGGGDFILGFPDTFSVTIDGVPTYTKVPITGKEQSIGNGLQVKFDSRGVIREDYIYIASATQHLTERGSNQEFSILKHSPENGLETFADGIAIDDSNGGMIGTIFVNDGKIYTIEEWDRNGFIDSRVSVGPAPTTADGHKLRIYEKRTEPGTPIQVSNTNTSDGSFNLATLEADLDPSLSDPRVGGTSSPQARGIIVGDYLYITNSIRLVEPGKIKVFNVKDISNITQESDVPGPDRGAVQNFVLNPVNKNVLFAFTFSNSNDELISIDISDPTSTSVLDSINLTGGGASNGGYGAISENGSVAAVSYGQHFHVIDTSNPSSLSLLFSTTDFFGVGSGIFGVPNIGADSLLPILKIFKNHAFRVRWDTNSTNVLVDCNNIDIINIENPSSPFLEAQISLSEIPAGTTDRISDIAISSMGYLYVLHKRTTGSVEASDRLLIYDISIDVKTPTLINQVDILDYADKIYLENIETEGHTLGDSWTFNSTDKIRWTDNAENEIIVWNQEGIDLMDSGGDTTHSIDNNLEFEFSSSYAGGYGLGDSWVFNTVDRIRWTDDGNSTTSWLSGGTVSSDTDRDNDSDSHRPFINDIYYNTFSSRRKIPIPFQGGSIDIEDSDVVGSNNLFIEFGDSEGHTAGDYWRYEQVGEIAATPDEYSYSAIDDNGATIIPSTTPVDIALPGPINVGPTGSVANVQITWGADTGHTLNDSWTFRTFESFKWTDDARSNPIYWNATNIEVSVDTQIELNNNVAIQFGSIGHASGDAWEWSTTDTFKYLASSDGNNFTTIETCKPIPLGGGTTNLVNSLNNVDNQNSFVNIDFASDLGHTVGDLWVWSTTDAFRIIITNFGYGYGFGQGQDYFDVFGFDAGEVGYGHDTFGEIGTDNQNFETDFAGMFNYGTGYEYGYGTYNTDFDIDFNCVPISTGNNEIGNGVTLVFGNTTSHSGNERWFFRSADTFNYKIGSDPAVGPIMVNDDFLHVENSVTVKFSNLTGHTVGDYWDFKTKDSFKWSDDGGGSFVATEVAITGASQTLNNGLGITIASDTGHNVGDRWDFSVLDEIQIDDGTTVTSDVAIPPSPSTIDIGNGLSALFTNQTGHALGDNWTFSTGNKMKWSNDNGSTFEATSVPLTSGAMTLEDGVTVTFDSITGHTLGDYWTFFPIVKGGFKLIEGKGVYHGKSIGIFSHDEFSSQFKDYPALSPDTGTLSLNPRVNIYCGLVSYAGSTPDNIENDAANIPSDVISANGITYMLSNNTTHGLRAFKTYGVKELPENWGRSFKEADKTTPSDIRDFEYADLDKASFEIAIGGPDTFLNIARTVESDQANGVTFVLEMKSNDNVTSGFDNVDTAFPDRAILALTNGLLGPQEITSYYRINYLGDLDNDTYSGTSIKDILASIDSSETSVTIKCAETIEKLFSEPSLSLNIPLAQTLTGSESERNLIRHIMPTDTDNNFFRIESPELFSDPSVNETTTDPSELLDLRIKGTRLHDISLAGPDETTAKKKTAITGIIEEGTGVPENILENGVFIDSTGELVIDLSKPIYISEISFLAQYFGSDLTGANQSQFSISVLPQLNKETIGPNVVAPEDWVLLGSPEQVSLTGNSDTIAKDAIGIYIKAIRVTLQSGVNFKISQFTLKSFAGDSSQFTSTGDVSSEEMIVVDDIVAILQSDTSQSATAFASLNDDGSSITIDLGENVPVSRISLNTFSGGSATRTIEIDVWDGVTLDGGDPSFDNVYTDTVRDFEYSLIEWAPRLKDKSREVQVNFLTSDELDEDESLSELLKSFNVSENSTLLANSGLTGFTFKPNYLKDGSITVSSSKSSTGEYEGSLFVNAQMDEDGPFSADIDESVIGVVERNINVDFPLRQARRVRVTLRNQSGNDPSVRVNGLRMYSPLVDETGSTEFPRSGVTWTIRLTANVLSQ